MTDMYHTLKIEQSGPVLEITLNRPEVRNAMNLTMVEELRTLFAGTVERGVRVVILRGAGGHFCAGGDVQDMMQARMQAGQDSSPEPYVRLNRAFGKLLQEVEVVGCVVIAILEGAVLGGGFGLACVSDVAIAMNNAQFRLPETGLGLIPAQIAPFVLKRIGLTATRKLALTGMALSAERAEAIGLIHTVVSSAEELGQALETVLEHCLRCAPQANQVTKDLLHRCMPPQNYELLLDEAARSFAAAVQGNEAMEGTMAFMQKRLPAWARTQGEKT